MNVLGRVYLRIRVGKCLLCVPAYVITNLHNNIVIGNNVMRKYGMIIDYSNDKLLIKAENVHALDQTKITPNSYATLSVVPKCYTLIPDVMGQLEMKTKISRLGVIGEKMITTLLINSTFSYTVFNTNNSALTLKCNTCVGTFCAIEKF